MTDVEAYVTESTTENTKVSSANITPPDSPMMPRKAYIVFPSISDPRNTCRHCRRLLCNRGRMKIITLPGCTPTRMISSLAIRNASLAGEYWCAGDDRAARTFPRILSFPDPCARIFERAIDDRRPIGDCSLRKKLRRNREILMYFAFSGIKPKNDQSNRFYFLRFSNSIPLNSVYLTCHCFLRNGVSE